MVLFKRKPVLFVRSPILPDDLDTEVYFIPETKEWFLTYEEYLSRMDYYKNKKFVCEITGNSCLTFFEAFYSEQREIKGVEKNFPETLKEHILRFLQFNRITRLDQLVDKVYSVFKDDYFPGETIYIRGPLNEVDEDISSESHGNSTTKHRGTIREKVQYGSSESVTTKYLVVRSNDMQQAIVTGDRIGRDRNHFTKWLIKIFIKLTMTRSHKVGAPWVVKNKYAKKFRIPQEFPEDLKQFELTTPSGEVLYEGSEKTSLSSFSNGDTHLNDKRRPNQRPTHRKVFPSKLFNDRASPSPLVKSETAQSVAPSTSRESTPINSKKRFPSHHLPEAFFKSDMYPQRVGTPNLGSNSISAQPTRKNMVEDLTLGFDLQTKKPSSTSLKLPLNARMSNLEIVKHHVELLDNESLSNEEEIYHKNEIDRLSSSFLPSTQQALEAWATMNIYHDPLKIDPFTFDDFVYAMGWNLRQLEEYGRCALLDEIWCAVLSALVSNRSASVQQVKESEEIGGIFGAMVTFPEEQISSDNSLDHSPTIENNKQETAQLVDKGIVNFDDKKMDNSENISAEEDDRIAHEPDSEDSDDDPEDHNAFSLMNYRNISWHERLRKRNFKDGNWQCILLGVLSMVGHVPKYKDTIKTVYRVLAPKDIMPTPHSALKCFYKTLDIDTKLKALSILTDLISNGTLVRNHIDHYLESSASLRRTRLDYIRDFRQALDESQKLNEELSSIYEKKLEEKQGSFSKKLKLDFSSMSLNEEQSSLMKDDINFGKAWEMKREQYSKINEIKAAKRKVERELVTLDCQRVKLLGKDRFYNRYWWFENNGLPTVNSRSSGDDDVEDEREKEQDFDAVIDENEGDDESTEETYFMGLLWVQGPSEGDLLTHYKITLDESELFNKEFQATSSISDMQDIDAPVVRDNDAKNFTEGDEDLIPSFLQMNFDSLPRRFVSTALKSHLLRFTSSEVYDSKNGNLLIDSYGGLPCSLSKIQLSLVKRKIIEEAPDPLFNGDAWRFYDLPEQIEQLIRWLNPWGKRESQLRKELLNVKSALVSSIRARGEASRSSQMSEEELTIKKALEKTNQRLIELDTGKFDDTEEVFLLSSKRNLRSNHVPRKLQKVGSLHETLENGNSNSIREMNHNLKLKLLEKQEENEVKRVLSYVNSFAEETLGKSLYDGGDREMKSAKRSKQKA